MDNRTKYTQKIIYETFMDLLKEKDIDKITVTEICKKAEINRATFYRYYENQYDLLDKIEENMLDEIKNTTKNCKRDIDELTLNILEVVYQNKSEWIILTGTHSDGRLVPQIYRFFSKYFKRETLSKWNDYKYSFIFYGYSGIINEWTKNGFKETPQDLSNYLKKLRIKIVK